MSSAKLERQINDKMRETEKDEKMLQSFHKIITTPGTSTFYSLQK